MLIALALLLVVVGAVLEVTAPVHAIFQAEPERIDTQQRLRIVAEAISKDLLMTGAGGGITAGAVVPGSTFATLLPFRDGLQSPDPPGSFFEDRVSILYVPPAGAETTLAGSTASTAVMLVRPQSGCPNTNPLCGFRVNQLAAVFDSTGAHDLFLITAIQNSPPALVGSGAALSTVYAADATVAEVVATTYWLQNDPAAGLHRIMRYDGRQTDSPIADNITRLRFEYYADSAAMPLSATELTDGPWRPDPSSPVRFDADLLRIRRVRALLQVRANRTFLTARIPDLEVSFDVALRNVHP